MRRFLKTLESIFYSTDNKIWIWAVVVAAGILLFYIVIRGFSIKETKLVFSQWWEDELESGLLEKLADDFEKDTGIKVILEKQSRSEIRALFNEASKAQNQKGKHRYLPADIYSVEESWIAGAEDIVAQLPVKAPVKGQIPAAEKSAGALPVVSFINPLFYNISLLESSGFDRPPKNRDEFLSYVKKITKPEEGIYGAALALGGEDFSRGVGRYILSWLWAAGIQSGTTDYFNFSSKTVTETLSFINQLKDYLYPGCFDMNEEKKLAVFAEGKAGMTIGSISDVKKLKNQMKDSFGITTIPAPAGYVGKPVFPLSFWYIAVGAESRNREAAEQFAAFLVERASELDMDIFAVPGGGTRNQELIKSDQYYSKAFEMYDAAETVREIYGTQRANRLNTIIYEEVQRMFNGKTPEDTARAIQERWGSR